MIRVLLPFLFMSYSAFAEAPAESELPEVIEMQRAKSVADRLSKKKDQIVMLETRRRQTLSQLFNLNKELKSISDKRTEIRNKLLSSQASVKFLSRDIAKLKIKIAEQKQWLGKRLKAIYKFHNMGPLSIFLNQSFQGNIDRNLRYLKSITERDYELIGKYHSNMRKLTARSEKLKEKVKTLIARQQRMNDVEKRLAVTQSTKSKLLANIKNRKSEELGSYEELRNQALALNLSEDQFNSLINVDFYLNKGRMLWPVQAPISKRYGLTHDYDYKFKLHHKGLEFTVNSDKAVQSIFDGQVEFAGTLPGMGKTVVINHGDFYFSVYSHLTKLYVNPGESIKTGKALGHVLGKRSKFYFEIRHYSDSIDPEDWLDRNLLVKSRAKNSTS